MGLVFFPGADSNTTVCPDGGNVVSKTEEQQVLPTLIPFMERL